MPDRLTPEEILQGGLSCNCGEMYKNRNMPDPDCARHYYESEIIDLMKRYARQERNRALVWAASNPYEIMKGFTAKELEI